MMTIHRPNTTMLRNRCVVILFYDEAKVNSAQDKYNLKIFLKIKTF